MTALAAPQDDNLAWCSAAYSESVLKLALVLQAD